MNAFDNPTPAPAGEPDVSGHAVHPRPVRVPAKDFDLVIIGTGPGGLAAAQRMTGKGFRVALVDSGRPVRARDRNAAADMTHGHGGAGLFSDGKFSFFPSASELWLLPHAVALRQAYDWTCGLLASYGLDTPPFPDDPKAYTVGTGEWVLKQYPSDYLSLGDRIRLVAGLAQSVDAEVHTETEVVAARYDPGLDGFRLEWRDGAGRTTGTTASRLILASGRFGPLGLQHLTRERSFRRLEVGFRIEQPAHQAFFRDMKQLDPKLRFLDLDGNVEWRTFCACRDGEAVLTLTQGLWTVSGRSDGPPTNRSNVGFNTRVLDESVAGRALAPVLAAMARRASRFDVALTDVVAGEPGALARFDNAYGAELRAIMVTGLRRLAQRFPGLDTPATRLIGPTLEGVGWYPKVDGDLRLLDAPAWVAGDACGLFRGIVAAMISGHYAASSALRELEAFP